MGNSALIGCRVFRFCVRACLFGKLNKDGWTSALILLQEKNVRVDSEGDTLFLVGWESRGNRSY